MNQRRVFLKGLAGLGAAVVCQKLSASPSCAKTPAQTAGPFYPGESQFFPDNDLTRVPGASRPALGEIIYIEGRVQDLLCQPVADVNVEIWQACASGRYNNDRDPNPAPLDPAFKYWGETFTDAQGRFNFKTIKPGAYPATEDWDRPPHIHVRVAKRGYKDLITQMYFKGDPLNDEDLILKSTPADQRSSLIVEFRPVAIESGATLGEFGITIEKV